MVISIDIGKKSTFNDKTLSKGKLQKLQLTFHIIVRNCSFKDQEQSKDVPSHHFSSTLATDSSMRQEKT